MQTWSHQFPGTDSPWAAHCPGSKVHALVWAVMLFMKTLAPSHLSYVLHAAHSELSAPWGHAVSSSDTLAAACADPWLHSQTASATISGPRSLFCVCLSSAAMLERATLQGKRTHCTFVIKSCKWALSTPWQPYWTSQVYLIFFSPQEFQIWSTVKHLMSPLFPHPPFNTGQGLWLY